MFVRKVTDVCEVITDMLASVEQSPGLPPLRCGPRIYDCWHMVEEKREAVLAIEAAVLPLMTKMSSGVSGSSDCASNSRSA